MSKSTTEATPCLCWVNCPESAGSFSDSDQRGTRNLIVFITAKTLNPEGSDFKEFIDPRMIETMGLVDSICPVIFPRGRGAHVATGA